MIVIDLEFGVSRTKEDQAEDLLLYRGHRWRRRSGDRGQQQAYLLFIYYYLLVFYRYLIKLN